LKIQHYIATFLLAIASFTIQAQEDCFPKRLDDRNILVYDVSDVLSAGEEQQLNNKLASYAAQTSNQIVVVIVDDICGDAPWNYATELGQAWGVGQGKFDNGIVVLVKPSGGQGQRKTHIAVGYGLEGAIPDITASQIVDRELLPNFSSGNIYKGLNEGTTVLMSLAEGEYNSDAYAQKAKKRKPFGRGALMWVGIMVFFGISRIVRARKYSNLNDITFWAALMMLSSSGRSHGGSWGAFSGGGGGGGFGGFGGGGFGGGGAGGSW
jgi:uncharacterized protein